MPRNYTFCEGGDQFWKLFIFKDRLCDTSFTNSHYLRQFSKKLFTTIVIRMSRVPLNVELLGLKILLYCIHTLHFICLKKYIPCIGGISIFYPQHALQKNMGYGCVPPHFLFLKNVKIRIATKCLSLIILNTNLCHDVRFLIKRL